MIGMKRGKELDEAVIAWEEREGERVYDQLDTQEVSKRIYAKLKEGGKLEWKDSEGLKEIEYGLASEYGSLQTIERLLEESYGEEELYRVINEEIEKDEELLQKLNIAIGEDIEASDLTYSVYRELYIEKVEQRLDIDMVDLVEIWGDSEKGGEEGKEIIEGITKSEDNKLESGDLIELSRDELNNELLKVVYGVKKGREYIVRLSKKEVRYVKTRS